MYWDHIWLSKATGVKVSIHSRKMNMKRLQKAHGQYAFLLQFLIFFIYLSKSTLTLHLDPCNLDKLTKPTITFQILSQGPTAQYRLIYPRTQNSCPRRRHPVVAGWQVSGLIFSQGHWHKLHIVPPLPCLRANQSQQPSVTSCVVSLCYDSIRSAAKMSTHFYFTIFLWTSHQCLCEVLVGLKVLSHYT